MTHGLRRTKFFAHKIYINIYFINIIFRVLVVVIVIVNTQAEYERIGLSLHGFLYVEMESGGARYDCC